MQTRPQPTREQLLAAVRRNRWIALGMSGLLAFVTLVTAPLLLWTSDPGDAVRAVIPTVAMCAGLLIIVFGCVWIPASTGAGTGVALWIASAATVVASIAALAVVVAVAGSGELTPALTTVTLYLATLGPILAVLSPVITLHRRQGPTGPQPAVQ